MKLSDKFLPYCDHEYANREDNAENCVEVAEDFAIGFTEWIMDNCDLSEDRSLYSYDSEDYTNARLLEIYKKENEL